MEFILNLLFEISKVVKDCFYLYRMFMSLVFETFVLSDLITRSKKKTKCFHSSYNT